MQSSVAMPVKFDGFARLIRQRQCVRSCQPDGSGFRFLVAEMTGFGPSMRRVRSGRQHQSAVKRIPALQSQRRAGRQRGIGTLDCPPRRRGRLPVRHIIARRRQIPHLSPCLHARRGRCAAENRGRDRDQEAHYVYRQMALFLEKNA